MDKKGKRDCKVCIPIFDVQKLKPYRKIALTEVLGQDLQLR